MIFIFKIKICNFHREIFNRDSITSSRDSCGISIALYQSILILINMYLKIRELIAYLILETWLMLGILFLCYFLTFYFLMSLKTII